MTMTLDEVRKTRFHMSRRNGYEVTDVDIFVDKVEETIQALTAENDALRNQPASGGKGPDPAELNQLKSQNASLHNELNKSREDLTRLQSELDYYRSAASARPTAGDTSEVSRREIDTLRAQLAQSQDQLAQVTRQLQAAQAAPVAQVQDEGMRRELEALRSQLAEARSAVASAPSRNDYMQLTGENQHLREQVERMMTSTDRPAGVMPMVVTTSPEASSAVVRLVQLATEQAESLVTEASSEVDRRRQTAQTEITKARQEADSYVNRVRSEADAHATQVKSEAQFAAEEMTRKATESANQMTTEAKQKADQTEHQARANAEKLVQDAQTRASTIDAEAASRRKELFSALESERDTLFAKIEKLKTYEKSYRQTMTGYLKSQIERLESSQFSPDETPELLTTQARTAQDWAGTTTSSTPRLDALLG